MQEADKTSRNNVNFGGPGEVLNMPQLETSDDKAWRAPYVPRM
jgi:hypothetical protein